MTSGLLGLLGTNASRAFIHHRIKMLELRDTFHEFVSMVKVVVTGMTEALVPKEASSGSRNCVDRGVLVENSTNGSGVRLRWRGQLQATDRGIFLILPSNNIFQDSRITRRSEFRVRQAHTFDRIERRSLRMRCG